MKKCFILFCCALCSCLIMLGQHGQQQPSTTPFGDSSSKWQTAFQIIERMYREHATANHIPGLAFGIVADGKLVFSKGLGYGDLEKKVPVTPASVYRIASMTKSFTAMAILKLRDDGRLRLDDPVSKYIPEIAGTKLLTADAPPVTIRNLLTHTAGFPEDNPWGDRQLERTDKQLIDFIRKGISMSSVPGVSFEYSNLGFAMLGYIVKKASGQPYEKYIKEKIFIPLGMEHSFWEYTDVPATLLVNGYRRVNENWIKEKMLHGGAYGAMGGMLTSIYDFSRYMALHMSAWPPGTENARVVKKSTLREMHQPGNVSYLYPARKNVAGVPCPRLGSYNNGLGYTKDCIGTEMIGHSGGLPGFGTHWTFLPQYRIGVVSFCNLTYAATSALNARVIDTLIALCNIRPLQVAASAILEQRKEQIITLLPDWKGAEQSGIFSENFFFDYFTDSLRKVSQELFRKAGKIHATSKMFPENQLRGDFTLYGEHADISIGFTLSPENPPLIQEFRIHELPKTDTAFSRYGLKTIRTREEYDRLVANDSNQLLVPLLAMIPGINLDIRYAGSNNIMKRPLYRIATAYMRRPAAIALQGIQNDLKAMGYGLKVFDGYRPYSVTVQFYEKFLDSVFVASPYTGSRHNRGCAVDLTLIDLKTGKELKMPTAYDSFTKEAAPNYPVTDAEARKNRELLQAVMIRHGFQTYPSEWWHFDFTGWDKYPVMDITFEMLE